MTEKMAAECLQMGCLSWFSSWGDLIINLFTKNVFFANIESDYLLKIKKDENTVSYLSNQDMLEIFF